MHNHIARDEGEDNYLQFFVKDLFYYGLTARICNSRDYRQSEKVHDFLTVGAAAPLMETAVVGLSFDDSYYEGLCEHYTHMKNLFTDGLKDIGLQFSNSQGAYYVLVDISEFGYERDIVFCEDLARKVGVGAVPGSSFFKEPENRYIRFHFAKQDTTLSEALEQLADIRKKMG